MSGIYPSFVTVMLMAISVSLFLLPALAQVQSHPVSQIAPADVNLNLTGVNITNVSYIFFGNGSVDAYIFRSGTDTLQIANTLIVRTLTLGWQNLTDYPTACPSGQAVVSIGDTLTCGQAGAGWTVSGTYLYNDTAGALIGIGTATPQDKLNIVGGNLNVTTGNITVRGTNAGILFPDGSYQTQAETNVSQLYGWNGTAWIGINVTRTGIIRLDVEQALATNADTFDNRDSPFFAPLNTTYYADRINVTAWLNTSILNVTSGNISITGVNAGILFPDGTFQTSGDLNTSQLYGYNGTNWVGVNTTRDGIIRLSVQQATTAEADKLDAFDSTFFNPLNTTFYGAKINVTDWLNASLIQTSTLNLGWQNLTDYPGACSSGQFVTTLGDTITCAAPASGGWTVSGSTLYNNTAGVLVGIGTSTPLSTLEVSGNLSVSGSTNSSIDISTLFIDATNNRVGIGTTSPSAALEVSGNLIAGTWINGTNLNSSGTLYANRTAFNGVTYTWPTADGSSNQVLSTSGAGALSWTTVSSTNNMTGYGTAGYVPLWFNTTSLNNSVIYQLGGNIGIGTATPTQKLHVEGNVNITGNITVNNSIFPAKAPAVNLSIKASTGSPVMALGSDGFARIAIGETTTEDVEFIQCTNADCSSRVTTTVEDVQNYSSQADAMAIDLDSSDNAMIVYLNKTDVGNVRSFVFIQCTNAACTTNSKTRLSINITSGYTPSMDMRVGSDNFARVAYANGSKLVYVQCTNAACTTRNENIIATTANNLVSLALNSTDFGKIVWEGTTGDALFIQCTNAACNTNTTVEVDSSGATSGADIDVGTDGLVRIASVDNNGMDYIKCTNADCSTNEKTTLAGGVTSGRPSLDVGSDDNASIGVSSILIKCLNSNCSQNTQNDVGGFGISSAGALEVNANGLPRFAGTTTTYAFYWACPDSICENPGSSIGSPDLYFYRVYAHTFRGKQTTVDSFDVAEDYAVRDTTIGPGDVVIVSPNQSHGTGDVNSDIYVDKSSKPYQSDIIGVISTKPGVLLSDDSTSSQKRPVSLSGRVPVKVSTENGPIAVGDYLTSSTTSGVAMKSTKAGRVIGVALEPSDSNGKVIVFVNPHYWDGNELSKLKTENEALKLRLDDLLERVSILEKR